jgi:hypothetical protein
VATTVGEPVAITVRARPEIVITGTRYESVEQLRAEAGDDQ